MSQLEEKIDKAKRVIYLASMLSNFYYDAPLLVPYRYGDECKALLKLMNYSIGNNYGMKITHSEYIKHRMSVLCGGLSDFAVLGDDVNLYSYEHASEVFVESQEIKDPNWDCLFITTMKAKGNTAVYPLKDFTEEDIREYLYGKM